MPRPIDEPRDGVLVVSAILGDLTAFNELAMRYRAAVVRTAEGIVGREHAEDVAQDSLLLAFKALPSIEEPSRFASWLFAITRNRAIRFGQQQRALRTASVELDEVLLETLPSISTSPSTLPLEAKEQDAELQSALGRVKEEYALVLRLHFLDEVPLKRIASFLGIPLSTVKWRVHRGKRLLKQEIERLRSQASSVASDCSSNSKENEPWKENRR